MSTKFLFHPYLPAGQVHVLAGSSGTGKTTLISQALANPLINWGKVLYIATDRRTDSMHELWRILGLDLPHVTVISLIDQIVAKMEKARSNAVNMIGGTATESLFSLSALSKAYDNHNTIIIDPAVPVLPIKNFNDMGQVARAMAGVAAWAQLLNVTIILVFHTNKTKKDADFLNLMNRISGSHGLLGYASTKALLLGASELEGGPALVLEGQHFASEKIFLERQEGSPALSISSKTDEEEEVIQALALQTYLPPPGEDFKVTDLIVLIDKKLSRATIFRQIDRLVEMRVIQKIASGTYQVIPPVVQ